jgi:hypothetical protein
MPETLLPAAVVFCCWSGVCADNDPKVVSANSDTAIKTRFIIKNPPWSNPRDLRAGSYWCRGASKWRASQPDTQLASALGFGGRR